MTKTDQLNLSLAAYRSAKGAGHLLLTFALCLSAKAQVTANGNSASRPEPAYLDHVPRVPGVGTLLPGFNAGLTISGAHNSAVGWYILATPAVSYTFSPRYSADASISIYPYRLVQDETPSGLVNRRLDIDRGDLGDTLLGFHASFNPRIARNIATASLTIPTGDRSRGLSTGRVTFDFSDHLEHYFGQTSFLVDIGAGDSSDLVNRLVTNNYTSLGPLVHFQTGFVFWLPGRNYIRSIAYEQLPIGNQTLYTTLSAPGQPDLTVATGTKASEDNGFTTSVGIPLNDHITLSSYYNRSLRLHLDTVSIGLTYVLRGRAKGLSMVDKALREAEGVNQ